MRKVLSLMPSCLSWIATMCSLLVTVSIAAGTQDGSTGSAMSARQETTYSLSGTVVNSVTGEPIGHALVQLNADAPATPVSTKRQVIVLEGPVKAGQSSTLTDSEGHFKFDGLQQMRASVSARKPGFFSSDQLLEGPAPENVEIGQNSDPVLIKLIPEGLITGRVTNANGAPIEGVTIHIGRLEKVQGREQLQEAHQSVTTNDEGEFRVAGLPPGAYYVSAHPNWNHDQAQTGEQP